MKKYRRIELTAFRRRVTIVSSHSTVGPGEADPSVNDSESQETIAAGSDEGREILIEAVRFLEDKISKQRLQESEPDLSNTNSK